MAPLPGPTDRVTPVGRGAKVRKAVLAATLAELAENGYAALTVDNIARRSGVNKTTVYRRWRDRENLIADAVADLTTIQIPMADSQNIDIDLRAYARSLVGLLNSPTGRALLAALGPDTARNPQVTNAKRRFLQDRYRRAEPLVSGAIARGQLPADTDSAELIKTMIAPIYLRLLVTAEPVDEATADAAVRIALTAARAGLLGSRVES
jgi:AcrR family transcriptional regulator